MPLTDTTVQAHQHADGAEKHGPQALKRSRVGFGTKIHALIDALGNPHRFHAHGSRTADITQAVNCLVTRIVSDK